MPCVEATFAIRLLTLVCLSSYFLKAQDCDRTYRSLEQREGNFSSPGGNSHYPNNRRCVYTFIGEENEKVNLTFNLFELQGMTPECLYDYIDVYIELQSVTDNLLEASVLGRFCGDSSDHLPQHLISLHNIIVIVFFSDDTKTDEGFEGNYNFIDATTYNVGALASPSSCSYTINSKSQKRGHIMSPTYPGVYPDNMQCTYLFQGVPGERIKLRFDDFSIFHGGDYCPFDYVLVTDGKDSYAQDIGLFCGKYSEVTLFSTREFLYLEFVTRTGRVSFDRNSLDDSADYKFDRRGFKISYVFSDRFAQLDLRNSENTEHVIGTECDFRITSQGGSDGTFVSPGFPSNFPRSATCQFMLDGQMNARRLEKVKVKFRDFEISGDLENCTTGYLGVNYQGHHTNNVIEERFCGKLWPPELVSRDPRMVLTFDTHGATQAKFVAHYEFLEDFGIPGVPTEEGKCSIIYESKTRKRGTFNSPRHPGNYPAEKECEYIFRPSFNNEKLLISYDIFSFSPTKDTMCRNTDNMELFERTQGRSGKETYASVKKYCGQVFPAPILTSKETKLRFVSYPNSSHLGFKAKYEFLTTSQLHTDCGKTIHSDGSGGLIKSPNFPLKYKSYTFCNWSIQASKPENKILIQFETFKVEGKRPESDGDGCKNAVLRIRIGQSTKELCGDADKDKANYTYLSTGDSIQISFLTSTRAIGAKGFRVSWTEVHDGGQCYGFKCKKSGYCISSDLRCNNLPNCGSGDDSDEKCPVKAEVQILHIAIGTSISVFFCVVLLICGVYHRKKFRTRDRHGDDQDHVEVRYVAATSGSNTTDRLLTIDNTSEQTKVDQTENQVDTHSHHSDHNDHNDQNKQNHNNLTTPQEKKQQPRPLTAPKIQKVSIV